MKHSEKHTILGVHITDRVKHVKQVQKLFTDFGCSIKTRLGLHDAADDYCSPNGLIILEVVGPASEVSAMVKALQAVEGVQVKKMVFGH